MCICTIYRALCPSILACVSIPFIMRGHKYESHHALCTPMINSEIINVHPLIVSNIDWCVLKHSLIGLLRHHGNYG